MSWLHDPRKDGDDLSNQRRLIAGLITIGN